jgi:hypothetical protein
MEVSGQLQASTTLLWGEITPQYTVDRKLGGPQSRSERCGEEKNLAMPGIKPGLSNP